MLIKLYQLYSTTYIISVSGGLPEVPGIIQVPVRCGVYNNSIKFRARYNTVLSVTILHGSLSLRKKFDSRSQFRPWGACINTCTAWSNLFATWYGTVTAVLSVLELYTGIIPRTVDSNRRRQF